MFDNKPLEMPRMWTEAFRSLCHEDDDGESGAALL